MAKSILDMVGLSSASANSLIFFGSGNSLMALTRSSPIVMPCSEITWPKYFVSRTDQIDQIDHDLDNLYSRPSSLSAGAGVDMRYCAGSS